LLVVSIFQRAKLHFFLEINNKKTENFAKRLHFIIFYTLLAYAAFPFNSKSANLSCLSYNKTRKSYVNYHVYIQILERV
jgi:hypothetical protein